MGRDARPDPWTPVIFRMTFNRTPGSPGLSVLVGLLLFMTVTLSGLLGMVVLERTTLSADGVQERLEEPLRPALRYVAHLPDGALDYVGRDVGSILPVRGTSAAESRRIVRRDLMVTAWAKTTEPGTPVPASTPAVGGFTEGGTEPEGPPLEASRASTSDGKRLSPREWMRLMDSVRRHPARKALGNPRAPMTVVVYLDFVDPYSVRHLEFVLPALVRRFVRSDTVFYRVRHRPMDRLHPRAVAAANAAECAAEQEAFWRFTVLAAATRDQPTEERLIRLARRAGVRHVKAFRRCVRDREKLARVKREGEIARGLGVQSTPTLRIEDRLLAGPVSVPRLERVLRRLTN